MTLEQLSYLVAVERYHSMNTAAKALHVSQQNISHAIKKLEHELGLPLFERTNKGVTPTSEGLAIIDSAKKITDEADNITRFVTCANNVQAEATNAQISGDIHLSLAPYFAREPLLTLINRFLADYPRVNLDLYVNSTMSILERSESGDRQIALVNMTEAQLKKVKGTCTWLNCEIFSSDQLVVLANAHSKVGRQKSVSINKLLKQRLLFYNDSTIQDDWLLECFRAYGTLNTIIRTNNIEMSITSLKNNVALLPMAKAAMANFLDDDNITMVPVRPRIDVYNVLLEPNDQPLQPAERLLLSQLKNAI